ncbi:carbon starvation CstA family protein [Desulfovibrio litoralis]|uniref:Carbon starvation protein CstA n=1 Tax=Desulfovibrio litoralis DSM 11393 TaxID=1121455 RepID=A0A1M7RTM8_9BACT|nr:carbon starvation protein A [Desulfovibrio litoralis]SHN49486.1 Carbon starvation protein CstA [Desulfovibrio litoralis DSM 11393]
MPSYLYFFFAAAVLIVGYTIYSRVIDKIFGPDPNNPTPATTMADGVDFVKMPPLKLFLIQLLNIAGIGPIFGPILGALYGPWALVWIVAGSIFAGGVHDYFSGMLSARSGGRSIPDVVGENLGYFFKQFMRVFSVVLLLLVGVVFVTAPAGMLTSLSNEFLTNLFNLPAETAAKTVMLGWVVVIFLYYFLATLLPIDKIIGPIYPIFAIILLIMAVGVLGGLIVKGYEFYPGAAFVNQHPKGIPLWPLMFVTIACGALSGFHATQSPMVARCIPDEKCGRSVFYGAMIAEGLIALIWATAGMTFFYSPENGTSAVQGLFNFLAANNDNPGAFVNHISIALLGPIGGILAILGVVVLPITSGDTAFRAARLTIADTVGLSQKKNINRLFVAIPLFAVGIALTNVDFTIIWRYFGFANQALATVVLWTAAAYVVRTGSKLHWLISIPATFMTSVCMAFIAYSPIGFGLSFDYASKVGIGGAIAALVIFLLFGNKFRANPVKKPKPTSQEF